MTSALPPQAWAARARRVLWFLVAALTVYGWSRFDLVVLPEGARSPLYGIHAGDRLVVDRRPGVLAEGLDVLYRGPAGELLLGRTARAPDALAPAARAALEEGAAWVLLDRPIEGVPDSRTLGPIAADALVGRVVFVLPW